MSLNSLVHLLGDTQLQYRRLHLSDYVRELAPRPATLAPKILLPSFFTSLFLDYINISVYSVAGPRYSFWHCFLYILYPDFINTSWYDRKKLIDKLLHELSYESTTLRFHDNVPADLVKNYLIERFRINIITVDTVMIDFANYNSKLPTLILFKDDIPIYHVIALNDKVLLGSGSGSDSGSELIKGLNEVAPAQKTSAAPTESAETFRDEAKPILNKLKLDELKKLAAKYEISTIKQGKTKPISMTKADIIAAILSHFRT